MAKPGVYPYDEYYRDFQIIDMNGDGKILNWKHFVRTGLNSNYIKRIDTLINYNFIPYDETRYFIAEHRNVHKEYDETYMSAYSMDHRLLWRKKIGEDNYIKSGFKMKDGSLFLWQEDSLSQRVSDPLYLHSSMLKINIEGSILNIRPVNLHDFWYYYSYTYLDNGRLVIKTWGGDGGMATKLHYLDENLNLSGTKIISQVFFSVISGLVSDGKYIYYCFTSGGGLAYKQPFEFYKIDTNFNVVWRKTFFKDSIFCYVTPDIGLIRTSDNGFLISGIIGDFTDAHIKLNGNGDLEMPPSGGDACQMAYPNPANRMLHIAHPGIESESFRIEVSDMLGHVLISQPTTRSQEDLNISLLANGLYIYRLFDKSKIYCQGKFVKY
jgi:hypothetical protein